MRDDTFPLNLARAAKNRLPRLEQLDNNNRHNNLKGKDVIM